mmetsp:Transcript_12054/g.27992  ORF Transcript_12054/g.27992 Transcript_12054/m.27992 type:complete len:259 (+) Transcript_12054:57-833(+)
MMERNRRAASLLHKGHPDAPNNLNAFRPDAPRIRAGAANGDAAAYPVASHGTPAQRQRAWEPPPGRNCAQTQPHLQHRLGNLGAERRVLQGLRGARNRRIGAGTGVEGVAGALHCLAQPLVCTVGHAVPNHICGRCFPRVRVSQRGHARPLCAQVAGSPLPRLGDQAVEQPVVLLLCAVEVELDHEEELQLKLVHLRRRDPSNPCPVSVAVESLVEELAGDHGGGQQEPVHVDGGDTHVGLQLPDALQVRHGHDKAGR